MPFPLDFPQENVPYLKENIRYLDFPRKTTVSLHFGRTSCHFPRFPDENLRYLGCCCPEKTDVTLVVVVVVVVAVVLIIILFVVVVNLMIFYGYILLHHYRTSY